MQGEGLDRTTACEPPLASVLAGGRRAYITQSDIASKFMADLDPYDQYEASFRMEVAGTCLQQVCYTPYIDER